MKAEAVNLLKFIRSVSNFKIPIYQRAYSWTEEQRQRLWNDIKKAGSYENIQKHFLGSIMYIEEDESHNSPSFVIDGQQRLTTITLLLCALRDCLGENEEPRESFSKKKITSYYLLNEPESDERRYKLLLSEADRDALLEITDKRPAARKSEALTDAYEFFKNKLDNYGDLESICKGLEKLMVVQIGLSPASDDPQRIFESMNSTGLALSQSDLIRNFLLMGQSGSRQEELYSKYWRPMELDLGRRGSQSDFDSFMRHFLSFKTGLIPKIERVYAAFKDDFDKRMRMGESRDSVMEEMRKFSGHYRSMALHGETDPELRQAFADLAELKADVAYPMLLEWYDDYKSGKWSKEDFLEALKITESYVWRRVVCNLPSSANNKTFLYFNRNKSFNKDNYLESVKAVYLLLRLNVRFPNDEEFREAIKSRNLYTNRVMYWLRKLEHFDSRERADISQCSVEHIMPQNKNLSKAWQTELGPDWARVQEDWLHTLGNLTLTGYNQKYSDKAFADKKSMEHGFNDSPLWLNKSVRSAGAWNEGAIRQRAELLADRALKAWAGPKMDPALLGKYKDKKGAGGSYSLEDHPNLFLPKIKPLFEALREAVLNLDPSVSEEFLKLYVAYKLDTNFLDVTPRKTLLRLTLNMEYQDLNDPKGLARDMTNIGSWGNGNVEIRLSKLEELPDVMELIRQALETQTR